MSVTSGNIVKEWGSQAKCPKIKPAWAVSGTPSTQVTSVATSSADVTSTAATAAPQTAGFHPGFLPSLGMG